MLANVRASEHGDIYQGGGPLNSAVIQVESGLWVLLPPLFGVIEKGLVERFTVEARKDFDAIIFDLPNNDTDCVMDAVSCSNVLVMVVNSLPHEMNRVLARKIESQNQKETILVANGCSCVGEARRVYDKVVEIPEDRDLNSKMERGMFYKKGSPLTTGTEKVRDMTFGLRSQEDSGFRKVVKLLRG